MERFARTSLIHRKVTLYFHGEMFDCIHKIEARAYHTQIGRYAQYTSALTVHFLPRGGRNPRGLTQTYRPSLLILDGWGHPEPAEMFGAEEVSPSGATVSRARHSAFSPEWQSEFDSMIAAHVAATGATILADYRGHDSHAPAQAVVAREPAQPVTAIE